MSRRNIYDTISLSLNLSLGLGFLPTFLGKIGRKRFAKTNKFCTWIIAFYFIIFPIMLYIGAYCSNPLADGDVYNFNTLAKLLILVVTVVGEFSTFVLLIQSYVYKDCFKDFFNVMAAIDKILTKIGHTFNHRRDYYINTAINLAGPTLTMCNLAMQMWNMRRGTEKLPMIPPPLLFTHLFTFALIHQGESLFVMCNVILLRRFEAINLALQKMNEKFISRRNFYNNDKRIGIIREILKNSKSDEEILDICLRCHDKLCDLRDSVIMMFGFLVIAGSIVQFNTVVFAFCYCYYSASIRPISSLGWFFWAVYRIYELTRKAVSAHISTNEVQATLDWVGKLLIHSDINKIEKLNIFALQIKHRSSPVTALGLFPIDGSFAFTMIGACTTYITIIYQFQVNKLAC